MQSKRKTFTKAFKQEAVRVIRPGGYSHDRVRPAGAIGWPVLGETTGLRRSE